MGIPGKKINSRKKGASFELRVINLLKTLGWGECCSSRSESKRKDDLGIDICYSDPLQIQCKSVERFGAYHDTLASMPKKKGIFNLLFHKRNRRGVVVAMEEDTFFEILDLLIESGHIDPAK